MHHLLTSLIGISLVSVSGFVVVAALWLRRLRQNVNQALAESASQQVLSAQRMAETLAQVHKQQRNYEQQLQLLAQANSQLRQGLVTMATRLEHYNPDSQRNEQTIH